MEQVGELLNVVEVAEVFHISRYTVYDWIERGYLEKIVMPSHTIKITRRSVDKLLLDGKDAGVREIKDWVQRLIDQAIENSKKV